jgi:3-phosphoshikimate 1-carboxyvinyltransferase
MGAQVVELADGLEIHGRAELRGARVASFGDHRIAMAFAIAGMFADGETIVQDVECVRESYPGFEKMLDEFVSSKRVRLTTPVISSLSPAKPEEE